MINDLIQQFIKSVLTLLVLHPTAECWKTQSASCNGLKSKCWTKESQPLILPLALQMSEPQQPPQKELAQVLHFSNMSCSSMYGIYPSSTLGGNHMLHWGRSEEILMIKTHFENKLILQWIDYKLHLGVFIKVTSHSLYCELYQNCRTHFF